MLTGEDTAWRRSVFAFAWAEVEFVRWRDGKTVNAACERIAARGLGFDIRRQKTAAPLYSLEWHDGRKVEHYRRGMAWVYEALRDKGAAGNSTSLRKLYDTARRKRPSDRLLRRDSDFLLETLKHGRDSTWKAEQPLR
jgi:hypothetical protein